MVIRKTHGFSDPHRVCQEANAQGPPPRLHGGPQAILFTAIQSGMTFSQHLSPTEPQACPDVLRGS